MSVDQGKINQAKTIINDIFELQCTKEDLNKSYAFTLIMNELLFRDDELTLEVMEVFKYYFNLIADKPAETNRAIWDVLTLIKSDQEPEIIKEIFESETNKKLEIILATMINALCLYGDTYSGPNLAQWVISLIEYLEEEKNYTVLLNVSQYAIKPALKSLEDCNLVECTFDFTILILTNGIVYATFVCEVKNEILNATCKFVGSPDLNRILKESIGQLIRRVFISDPDFFEGEFRDLIAKAMNENNLVEKIRHPAWFSLDFKPSDIENILKCYNCFGRHALELFVCVEGHPICKNCKRFLKFCSVCTGKISEQTNPILNKVIQNVKFSCKYGNQGCEETFLQRELKNHEDECKFEVEICDLVIDHLENEHGRKCFQIVVKRDFKKHALKCHKHLIAYFDMGKSIQNNIDWNKNSKARLLQDKSSNKLFLERLIKNQGNGGNGKNFSLGYYYLGSLDEIKDMTNYMYLVEFDGGKKKLRYSGLCYKYFVPEGKDCERLLFKHKTEECSSDGNKVDNYTVTIKSLKMDKDGMEL